MREMRRPPPSSSSLAGGSARPAPSRMLVATPEADIAEAIEQMLTEEGYEVHLAATLVEAHALVDEQIFAFILTDLFSALSQDRVKAAEALKRHAAPTPVGVVTAWPVAPDEIERRGFACFISQPFDVEYLLSCVAAALKSPLTPEQTRQAGIIERYFAAHNAKDWDAIAVLCADDFVYERVGQGPALSSIRGRDAYRAFIAASPERYAEALFDELHIYALPDRLSARFHVRWRAPRTPGNPADREVTATGSVVFAFTGERISRMGPRVSEDRLHPLDRSQATP